MSQLDRVARTTDRASGLSAMFAVLIGAAVLLGWAAGSAAMVRIVDWSPPVAPLTAVGAVVLGLGLLAVRREPVSRPRAVAASLAGAAALVGGLLTVLSYTEAIAPLDGLLFAGRSEAWAMPHSGRPALEVGVALAALGAGLLLLLADRPLAVSVADVLALSAGLIALAGVVAFAVSEVTLGSGDGNGVALMSGIVLWLLCLGVLSARPEHGPLAVAASPGSGGVLMRRLLPTLGLAPVGLTLLAAVLGQTPVLPPATVFALLGVANVVVVVVALVAAGTRLERLEDERRHAVAAAAHRAEHDALTGLPLRASFTTSVREAMARPGDPSAAVLAIDLDRLHSVNDRLGDPVGDDVLVAVAERLSEALRAGDQVARLGGDEFAVLCQDLSGPAEVTQLANRLAGTLRRPVRTAAGRVQVSATIGVALADGSADLLLAAEAALSRAKAEGGGSIGRYDERLRREDHLRFELEQDLRDALHTGDGLVLHYQPVIDLRSGAARSVEALLRWQHPERGLLPPSLVLEVAREAGLIERVSDAVLVAAARQAAAWQDETDLRIFVNLTGAEVARADLPDRVLGAVAEAGCPADRLGVEVTEQQLLGDLEVAQVNLRALNRAGIATAIDDFGTGYSSLTYLRRLPVDILKIDGSLVRGLAGDLALEAVVSAAVRMGHALGLQVVGEGVEDGAHELALYQLGADAVQGYHYTRPLPADELLDWLPARTL